MDIGLGLIGKGQVPLCDNRCSIPTPPAPAAWLEGRHQEKGQVARS